MYSHREEKFKSNNTESNLPDIICDSILKVAKDNHFVNCIGTALYLSGITPCDDYILSSDVDSFLKNFERIDEPKLNSLVLFRMPNEEISHMGVVVSINPLKMTHRTSFLGPVIENDNLEEVFQSYKNCKIEYRKIW